MVIRDNIPFPQADDFNKIIKILNIDDLRILKSKECISNILGGIAERQAQYYLSACMYLDIIDRDRNLTEFGIYLRNISRLNQEIELAAKIVSLDIFGYIFFLEKKLQTKLNKDEVVDIMKKYINFESEEMYKRRAQTIIKWVEWINNSFDLN